MATPFLSEIVMVSFNFPPKGYALCNGQLLPINQNQALFALLGTTYGGNGQTNFALPNLRGRFPVHEGGSFTLGSALGTTSNTLNLATMPEHTHPVTATIRLPVGDAATTSLPDSAFFAEAPAASPRYGTLADDKMAAVPVNNMISDTLGTPLQTEAYISSQQPFNNIKPYLAINFVIALQGVFPSQT